MIFDKIKKIVNFTKKQSSEIYGEKKANYYDSVYDSVESFHKHYTESPYYFLHTVIIEILRANNAHSILEVACGTGQLAHAIIEELPYMVYRGFDFSSKAINYAQQRVPLLKFEVQNALSTDLFDTVDYDTIVSTEFLEHIKDDLLVIARMRLGTKLIATVPNFPYVSHERYFIDEQSVAERYSRFFDDFVVRTIKANNKGKQFYLFTGTKNDY